MTETEFKKQVEAALAREQQTAETWWTANRGEAIALIAVSLGVGLLIGALIGYLMHGSPA